MKSSGILILGSRPIGNFEDVSINLINRIFDADIIIIENKIPFEQLINYLNIKVSAKIINIDIQQFFNKGQLIEKNTFFKKVEETIDFAVQNVKNGKNVLLLSDEGSSVIIDPGIHFLKKFKQLKLPYKVMAGPNAIANAVSNCSFIDNGFTFLGMIQDYPDQIKILKLIKESEYPTISFIKMESSFPILLNKIINFINEDRKITFCLNMTSSKELILEDTILEFNKNLKQNDKIWKQTACLIIDKGKTK